MDVRLKSILILFFAGCMSNSAWAQEWILNKDKDGVEVYTRKLHDEDVKQVQIRSEIQGVSLSSFAALFRDFSSYYDWVYGCADVKLLKEVSDHELYYYTKASFPWPFDDRDFVIHSTVWQDSMDYSFHSKSTIYKGKPLVKLKKNTVRVSDFNAEWVITPLENGNFGLRYTFQCDPGGKMPSWLVNSFLDVGPLKTINNIEKYAQHKKYADAFFPYLTELSIIENKYVKVEKNQEEEFPLNIYPQNLD